MKRQYDCGCEYDVFIEYDWGNDNHFRLVAVGAKLCNNHLRPVVEERVAKINESRETSEQHYWAQIAGVRDLLK